MASVNTSVLSAVQRRLLKVRSIVVVGDTKRTVFVEELYCFVI